MKPSFPLLPLTAATWRAPRNLLILVLVAATYLAAGVLSLELYPVGDGLAGIWPPAGIAVAAALIVGPFATASILVGDFLFSLYAGWPPIPALTLALGSLAEVLVAWLLLVRWMPIDLRLQRTRDVAAFIVMGALPGALLCVALRVGLLALLGRGNELTAEHVSGLVIGFVAHSLGILVVAPVVLTWTAEPGLPRQRIEFYLLLLAAITLNVIGFSVTVAAPGSAILYTIFVAVLWAALRFGPRETALVIAMTGVFATWAAGSSSGPFMLSNQREALISLSLFLFVATATALFLAAAARERDLYLRRVVESEHAQRALIDQMAEGVITLDSNGRLDFASQRFCALCGKSQQQLLGQRLDEIFDDAAASALESLPSAIPSAHDIETEVSLALPGQGNRTLVITARGLTAADGHPTGTLAVIGDITDRRRAEELSQQHLRQLAHMGRVKSLDEMAVAIAHEVAQPLTAITTYVQAALRFLPAEGVHRSVIQDALLGASSQARRASAVVSRIRAFVQDRPWQPRELLVHDLLTETGRFASPEARQHGASLLVAPSRTPCRLLGDEIQIQQVLLNLIRNAAEAMAEHSSPRRQIALAAERTSDGMVDVSVSDTGPGIEAAYRDKLFEAFCSSKKDGVGIGLALCRSIVDAHGGRLWAETPATGGAIFHVVLREVKHGKHTTS